MVPYAWVLNFDADEELAAPGASYTPKRALLDRFATMREKLGPLIRPHDVVLADRPLASALEGRAWCPTPRALKTMRALGATAPEAPSLEVLRRVNDRRFNAELGQTLPGARFVESVAAAERVIREAPDRGEWLMKRPFGFAGRGRRKVRAGAPDAATRAWIEASLARFGGLQIEPWVEREIDAGIHGLVERDGSHRLGRPTVQRIDEHGQWLETRLAGDELSTDERASLFSEASRVAVALHAAGYFGPFGIDAFRHRARDGTSAFDARCEINARYSMGWAIGMLNDSPR